MKTVAPNNYSRKDSLDSLGEKLLALHIYLLRKVILGVVLGLVGVASRLSKLFGFNFSASVSDRESWKWEPHKYVPVYRARVEKVE